MDKPTLSGARVVVGLDFGTTFSGFAYAHKSAPNDIFTQYEWPLYEQGGGKHYCKTLTGAYYERDINGTLSFHSWGWEARVAYMDALRQHVSEKKTAARGNIPINYPLVGEMLTKFKLHLASEEGPPAIENAPAGLDPNQIITDYLRGIGDFIVTGLQARYGRQLTKEAIQWCLTVPSIWDDHAKQQMKLCMEKAGLVGRHSDMRGRSPHELIMVLEPEAASVYCHKHVKSGLNLRLGDKFMVVDIGGGTTDIVVQERANHTGALKIREVSRSSGGLCGGTYVDKNFMTFLKRKIGCLDAFLKQHPDHEPKLLGWWESAKSTFDGSPTFQTTCQLSPNLARAWEEYLARDWEEYDPDQCCDEVDLSCEDMKAIFDPVVGQNLELIEARLSETPDIKVIMAVGGFSGSPYLMSRIKATFSKRVSEIVSPPNPGSAVCQGAVALALHGDTLISRVARKTYGIGVVRKFKHGDCQEFRKVIDGIVYCDNLIDIFVQRGDQVDTDHSVTRIYNPVCSHQKCINISLYSSDDLSPRYTVGENVRKEGSFEVDMSDDAEDLDMDRRVSVGMYFGRSTVEVIARGVNFGDKKVHEMLPVRFEADLE